MHMDLSFPHGLYWKPTIPYESKQDLHVCWENISGNTGVKGSLTANFVADLLF